MAPPSFDREFQNRLGRIEELIAALEKEADPLVRERARELIQTLLALHASGFERILNAIYESGPDGRAMIDELAGEPIVSGLLLLHGLHPLDLETRVRTAIEEVKPRLGLHGGSVQLVGITPNGAVRLQLEGNCEGCPSSRMTLKYSIEEALYAAAPDITALEVNGLSEEYAPAAANPMFTECPSTNGNGQVAATGGNR